MIYQRYINFNSFVKFYYENTPIFTKVLQILIISSKYTIAIFVKKDRIKGDMLGREGWIKKHHLTIK